jgi:hypothetical protein
MSKRSKLRKDVHGVPNKLGVENQQSTCPGLVDTIDTSNPHIKLSQNICCTPVQEDMDRGKTDRMFF